MGDEIRFGVSLIQASKLRILCQFYNCCIHLRSKNIYNT